MSEPPITDRYERLAFFDEAEAFTPYVATEAGGALFLVKTEDKHIARSLFAKRARGELAILDRAVTALRGLRGDEALANSVFVDVGANIGTTTIPAVRSYGFSSAVALEPEPENCRVLRLNLVLNEVSDRVTVLDLAASNQVGTEELVVNRERGGKHWIVTDRSKLSKKDTATAAILEVETTTLDHLVETGQVDGDRVGLVWIDAEAHEGHILEGASTLIGRGVPLVLEWNPVLLDRVGDRDRLQRAVADAYTHFAPLGGGSDPKGPRHPLTPIAGLAGFADRFLDRKDAATKTDILIVRLEDGASADLASLDAFIQAGSYADDDELPPPAREGAVERIRSRLRRG